ncbi:hypothetical protein EST38_g6955 [Candolleomyces aberdarensis]|uniref:Uncharacterized protein n=1 Tax=Candolleomyces aberdarensis TaxID=2316362 RepID=A0A4Q2DJQ8_9AGAR|nr:hypothetical protein EST38_g6955 [Candolleomyces aberdarensis]
MPAAQFAHGPRRAPRMLTPPPQRILTAGGRPSYTISCNSAPGIHSDGDDSAATKMRLHAQLTRTAALLAKSVKQIAMLSGADAFEVEVVERYPLAPLLQKKPRPLWARCLRRFAEVPCRWACYLLNRQIE